jgi:hypothetical protein
MANALDMLEQDREQKRRELAALEQAIALLRGEVVLVADSRTRLPSSSEFKGLGIVDAAQRLIKEMGEPQTTREIADGLLNRGLETRSKNFVATVYATLENSKGIKRTSDNRWDSTEKSK